MRNRQPLMFFLQLFFGAVFQPSMLINLEEHGINNIEGLGFFKVGLNTLVSNSHVGVLQVFDDRWRPVHRFDKVGKGPGEFERPVVLGVTDDRIYVASQSGSVMVLNSQLRVQPVEVPSLQGHLVKFGVHVAENRFRVFGTVASHDLIWDLALEKRTWVKESVLFPRPKDRRVHSQSVYLQGALIYATKNGLVEMRSLTEFETLQEYEIRIHDMGSALRENLVQVLRQPTSGLEGVSGHLQLVHAAFKSGNSYFVHLVFIRPTDYHRVTYLDKFANDGTFQGRKPIHDKWYFYPIRGTDEVVQVDRDNLLVYRFHW